MNNQHDKKIKEIIDKWEISNFRKDANENWNKVNFFNFKRLKIASRKENFI